jgi:hypothetical protein
VTVKEGWTARVYEDFAVGDIYPHPLGRTVLAADNIWFTLLTQNTNPIHFDRAYAAKTEFGRPLVNSTLTLALVTGQSVADISQNAMANLAGTSCDCPVRSSTGGLPRATHRRKPKTPLKQARSKDVEPYSLPRAALRRPCSRSTSFSPPRSLSDAPAFPGLGPEARRRFQVATFPLAITGEAPGHLCQSVIIASVGDNLHATTRAAWRR